MKPEYSDRLSFVSASYITFLDISVALLIIEVHDEGWMKIAVADKCKGLYYF